MATAGDKDSALADNPKENANCAVAEERTGALAKDVSEGASRAAAELADDCKEGCRALLLPMPKAKAGEGLPSIGTEEPAGVAAFLSSACASNEVENNDDGKPFGGGRVGASSVTLLALPAAAKSNEPVGRS